MKKELLKVIEANLPAEVGKTLQIRLEQADKDSKEAEQLRRENENLKEDIAGIKTERDAAVVQRDEAVDMYKDNEVRRNGLDKRQNELDKQMSELRAIEAEKRADPLKEVLEIVFKSPMYKRQYQERNMKQKWRNLKMKNSIER